MWRIFDIIQYVFNKTYLVYRDKDFFAALMAVKGLVAAIVQFLTDQLQDGDITADSRESLEVAIQCLESAYSVQASDAPVNFNLYQVYKSATEDTIPNPGPEATPEAKAEAERLKNEGNALMKAEKHHEALANYTKYL